MKIAYLIMAHGNYVHLQRLISALDTDGAGFFVHIDKKSPLPDLPEKVNFVKREKVYWAGFSLVQAALGLLEAAVETETFDYFVLLSGMDYPIVSNDKIAARLKNGGYEYINILEAPHPSKPMDRFTKYYFDRIDRRRKGIFDLSGIFMEKILGLFPRSKPSFKLFVGSQWFAFSASCARYIVDKVKHQPEYKRFFKNAFCPDEAFFQTLIGNSPFYKKCRHNLTYTDWKTVPAPAIITDAHLDVLKKESICYDIYGKYQPLFVRKLHDGSEAIIKRIDHEFRM